MPKDKKRKQRLKRAKKRVQTLVSQGVPFNPATASETAVNQAVKNTRSVGATGIRSTSSGAAGQISARAAGSATAPKGGPSTFTRKKKGSGFR